MSQDMFLIAKLPKFLREKENRSEILAEAESWSSRTVRRMMTLKTGDSGLTYPLPGPYMVLPVEIKLLHGPRKGKLMRKEGQAQRSTCLAQHLGASWQAMTHEICQAK